MSRRGRWTHGRGVVACFAMALAACGGNSAVSSHADGGDATSSGGGGLADAASAIDAPGPSDAPRSDVIGGDAADGVRAGDDAGDSAVSLVTAQYRACVAYFRAQCNRRGVCYGGSDIADPCPTVTDLCPDIEFAPGSLRTVATLLDCAQAWSSFPCSALLGGKLPSCAGIGGTLPDGAPCTTNLQCAGKLCGQGQDAQHPSCGACATRAVTGAACGTFGSCQYDEECLNSQCVKFTQDLKLGDTCGGASLCTPPNQCRSGASDGGSTCQAVPKLGDACADIIWCADSLCTAAHRCEPWPGEGMPCQRDAVFNRYMCGDAFTCDEGAAAGPTCILRPGAGVPCATTGSLEPSSCAAGLVCGCPDGTGSTCSTGTCVRRRQEGDTCGAPNDLCVPGTSCVSARCVAVSQGWMTNRCGP